jgi:hypothetical protein
MPTKIRFESMVWRGLEASFVGRIIGMIRDRQIVMNKLIKASVIDASAKPPEIKPSNR